MILIYIYFLSSVILSGIIGAFLSRNYGIDTVSLFSVMWVLAIMLPLYKAAHNQTRYVFFSLGVSIISIGILTFFLEKGAYGYENCDFNCTMHYIDMLLISIVGFPMSVVSGVILSLRKGKKVKNNTNQ